MDSAWLGRLASHGDQVQEAPVSGSRIVATHKEDLEVHHSHEEHPSQSSSQDRRPSEERIPGAMTEEIAPDDWRAVQQLRALECSEQLRLMASQVRQMGFRRLGKEYERQAKLAVRWAQKVVKQCR